MNIDDFRALVEIAESGSLSAASVTLNASQPGLSRLVQRVETELGARLFDRTSGGVRLTPAGELAVDMSREILRTYERLRGDISRLDDPEAKVIRVAASTTPGEYLAPDLAAGFAEVMPAVLLQVVVTDSAAVFRDLLAGRSDIGLSGMKPDEASLLSEPIARDEIVLAVPSSHPSAGGEISIEDLRGERLILREGGSATIQTVRQVLGARGMSLPSGAPSLTLSSTQSILSAVASGLGVGFVTSRAFDGAHPHGVSIARLVDTPITRDLYLLYPRQARLPAHVRTFIEFVRARKPNIRDG